MRDFYLKFTDEVEWLALGVERDPGIVEIDVIGTLYEVADVDVPATPLDGWHVNVRCMDGRDMAVLEPFAVVPANLRRVWA